MPHRLQIAFLTLRQAYAIPPEPAIGVLAALGALLAGFWNLHVVVLFAMVVGAGVWDLLAGSRRARKTKRPDGSDEFSERVLREGMNDKLFYLFLSLFFGACADVLLSLIGGAGDLGFTELFRTVTPCTSAALFFRLGKEAASITRNVEATPGGKGEVWNFIQFIDTLRYRLAGGKGMPTDRWTDGASMAETARLAELLEVDPPANEPDP